MIRINLLPPERRGVFLREKRAWLWMTAGFLLLLLSLYGYGSFRIASLEHQVETLRLSYALLTPTRERQLALESLGRDRAAREQVLRALSKERLGAYGFLLRLGVNSPAAIRLIQAEREPSGRILLTGCADNYAALTAYLAQLQNVFPEYTPVLQLSEQKNAALRSNETVYFEIKADLKEKEEKRDEN